MDALEQGVVDGIHATRFVFFRVLIILALFGREGTVPVGYHKIFQGPIQHTVKKHRAILAAHRIALVPRAREEHRIPKTPARDEMPLQEPNWVVDERIDPVFQNTHIAITRIGTVALDHICIAGEDHIRLLGDGEKHLVVGGILNGLEQRRDSFGARVIEDIADFRPLTLRVIVGTVSKPTPAAHEHDKRQIALVNCRTIPLGRQINEIQGVFIVVVHELVSDDTSTQRSLFEVAAAITFRDGASSFEPFPFERLNEPRTRT